MSRCTSSRSSDTRWSRWQIATLELSSSSVPGRSPTVSSRRKPWVRSAGGSTGFHLAIELAAARVALLDPDELLGRLDRRLPLLASRSRDTPARQRTLRATIEWSYELLDAAEQELFRKLAAFRGSFTIEAAEAVCDADLEDLESLVVKSLVRRWESLRLGMLDTIREYAVELLDAALDTDDVHRRHAEHFLSVAEEANLNAGTSRPGGQRLDIGLAERDNFRGAIAWAIRSDPPLGLEIASRARATVGSRGSQRGHSLVRAAPRASGSRVRCAELARPRSAGVRELPGARGALSGGRGDVGAESRDLRATRGRAWAGGPPSPPRGRAQCGETT